MEDEMATDGSVEPAWHTAHAGRLRSGPIESLRQVRSRRRHRRLARHLGRVTLGDRLSFLRARYGRRL
jgi:hypothetical protein